jgi:NAD-dependent SIR2 family protein deacetylase
MSESESSLDEACVAAKTALERADALLIAAGAGMGVDSGLPDFRGNEGFWKAYPPFAKLGLGFASLANPRWFDDDPALAWGFYGHRLELYRSTTPHAGFKLLRGHAATLPFGAFAYTSNVDGQFQKSGFADDRVCEAHGSIHHLQCVAQCERDEPIWTCRERVYVNPQSLRAPEPWPRCTTCGALARPNILMFGDGAWRHERTSAQEVHLYRWLAAVRGKRLVIVELGAGGTIPTVRNFSERLVRDASATLVRINPREPRGPFGTISLPLGALAALRRIVPGAASAT